MTLQWYRQDREVVLAALARGERPDMATTLSAGVVDELVDDNAANRVRILAAALADHREHLGDHFVVATGAVVRIRAATEQHDIP